MSSIINTFTNVNYTISCFFYNFFFCLCFVDFWILNSVSYFLRTFFAFSDNFDFTFFKCRIFFYLSFKRNFFYLFISSICCSRSNLNNSLNWFFCSFWLTFFRINNFTIFNSVSYCNLFFPKFTLLYYFYFSWF